MSKMDNLRAMREARYERTSATTARTRPAERPRATAAPVAPPSSSEVPEPDEGLCGHRAISGRTCTRERGHAAKSHRYS